MAEGKYKKSLEKLSEMAQVSDNVRGEAPVLEVYPTFVEGVGGHEALAQMLVNDFGEIRRGGSNKTKLEAHKFVAHLGEKWQEAQEKLHDLSNASEEDLQSVLTDIAGSLLVKSHDFRAAVIAGIAEEDELDLLIEMCRRAKVGRPVMVIDCDSPSAATENVIEEYDPDLEEEAESAVQEELADI